MCVSVGEEWQVGFVAVTISRSQGCLTLTPRLRRRLKGLSTHPIGFCFASRQQRIGSIESGIAKLVSEEFTNSTSLELAL